MTNRSRTALALICGLALGVVASMTGTVLADRDSSSPTKVTRDARGTSGGSLPWEDARRLAEVLERVKAEYVDPVDDHELMDNAVRGLVAGLDPYSAYLDRDEYDEIRLSTTGTYPGIGVEVAAEEQGIKVLRPIEDSPADRAGIRSGDMIVRIDGAPVSDDVDAAIDQMRGPAGTPVRLSVRRAGAAEIVDVALQRAQVEVHSVASGMLDADHAYLRISSFTDSTADEVSRALQGLVQGHAGPLGGLVIDLRNNPGGVLEAAVDVADAFLDAGVIVSAVGRSAESRFHMEATHGDLLGGARIAVLVNGGSASAAEIVAGALHDHGRAVLVGRRTYGKGSVQTVIPLSDGRAVKLTTSRYATPSGAMINERGIEPDVAIDGDEAAPGETLASDRELRVAVQALQSAPPPARRIAAARH